MDYSAFKFFKSAKPLFILADLVLIISAVFLSFVLRYDGAIPLERTENFLSFVVLAAILTIVVFLLQGLYEISWKFVSLTDLANIFLSVAVSGFAIGSALFFFRDIVYFQGFPRSVFFLYLILIFIFSSVLRFSKRLYWQIIRPAPFNNDFFLPLTLQTLNKKEVKNILITGGAGYIGSVLTRKLLENGYDVIVLDKLTFGQEPLSDLLDNPQFRLIKGDIFDAEVLVKSLSNIDAVINLAAIVGEPACVCQKDIALRTNYLGAVYVARVCKSLGIRRFIQASTCSAYGQSKDYVAKESSSLFPVDFYGETKIYAERELAKLADENFLPTILRFSTVYGLSPRMRFDLVVNALSKKAVKDKEITIFGGNQWRPLIHVSDASEAIFQVLKAPFEKVANQIFNVGSNSENYRISDIGEMVKKNIPGTDLKTIGNMDDKRSYRVDFSKIEKELKFTNKKRVLDGIFEIREAIESGKFEELDDKKYYNHMMT